MRTDRRYFYLVLGQSIDSIRIQLMQLAAKYCDQEGIFNFVKDEDERRLDFSYESFVFLFIRKPIVNTIFDRFIG